MGSFNGRPPSAFRPRKVSASIEVVRYDALDQEAVTIATAFAEVWWAPACLDGPPEHCYEEEGSVNILEIRFAGPLPLDESSLNNHEWEALEAACINEFKKGEYQ
tara:strand:- start:637 stop:951 length:315 start_codon:yes stop_codon:yes gene_type:complete